MVVWSLSLLARVLRLLLRREPTREVIDFATLPECQSAIANARSRSEEKSPLLLVSVSCNLRRA